MEIVALNVEAREKIGSAECRRLRRNGRLPAILYGMNRPPLNISLDAHQFEIEFGRGHRMYELKLGDQTRVGLLKDVGFNGLGNQLMHVDFVRVDDKKPVIVSVALDFVGAPVPVAGAIIDYISRDLDVACLPREIPASIEVRLGDLKVGQHVEASQIPLPAGVTLAAPPTKTVVSYHYKHIIEPVAGAAEEIPAEPVVLTERKAAPETGT